MSVRMRHTRSHTRNRRSHHKVSAPRLGKNAETGELHVRHRADMATGRYRGRVILDVAKKQEKKAEKARRRELEARGDGNEPPKDNKPVSPEEISKH